MMWTMLEVADVIFEDTGWPYARCLAWARRFAANGWSVAA